MLVLAADTSLPLLSVALIEDEAVIGAVAFEGRGSRNEKLLPAVDWILSESGVDLARVDLFATTRGPGSFTGVRIGLATLQGLAVASRKPLCAMSTHEAIAWSEKGIVTIADDAGRDEWYVSVFEDGAERSAPHLAQTLEPEGRTLLIGDFVREQNVALRCARRAREIELAGEGAHYRDVTPIYVRLAEAEVKLRERLDG